jgi:hypothetical protein
VSELDLAATMDGITATLETGGRAESMYPFPAEAISTPAVVVGYPTAIEFDATFRRGSDRAEFPVWFVVGRNDPKAARDALSAIIAGADSIKDLLDGDLGGVVSACRVTGCEPTFIDIAGVSYAAAKFTLEVYS